jgi:pimeloyl-ACP methyl ester carboxylesterase
MLRRRRGHSPQSGGASILLPDDRTDGNCGLIAPVPVAHRQHVIKQTRGRRMKVSDSFVMAGGHRLNVRVLGDMISDRPTLVFLHGGLDCIAMWRGLPEALVAATGMPALVYERWGHGQSDPLTLPKVPDHRLNEADGTLAEMLRAFDIRSALLVGHSYGGCLALLAAALHPDVVRAAVAIAPQLVMHPAAHVGLESALAAWQSGKLRRSLEKYHGANTENLFLGWIGEVETENPAIQARYEELLRAIRRPVYVLVGDQDEYGYQPNFDLIERTVPGEYRTLEVLPGGGHHPHWHNLDGVVARLRPVLEMYGDAA